VQQTISQAAQLYGKARSTIHRAIDAGRLSCSVRGDGVRVIQLAELIRLWGEPTNKPPETQQNATPKDDDTQQELVRELRALREEIASLREEVHQMRRLPAPEPQKGVNSVQAHRSEQPAHTPPKEPQERRTPPSNERLEMSFADIQRRLAERTGRQS